MSSRATTSTHQSRRHRSRSQQSRCVEVEKPKKKKTLSSTSLVSIPNSIAVIKLSMLNSGLLSFDKMKLSVKDENNPLSQTIPDAPTELKFFIKLCEQRRKFPVLYKIEFTTAVETHACRHATKKNNLEKNQNQKTIPYDFNRVVLQKIPGVTDSDYINASYVDSLLKPNAYIVSQGPTEETVFDFWRMVWQENVSCIVMLTKTFDFTKVMCVQYWPASKEKDECYGELPEYQINIGVVKEEELANFHIRTFRLYKMQNNVKTEERILLQFHYTAWSSHSCPFSNAILEFRRRVRSVVGNTLKSDRPMLVHCNDGGGRSGVFMAIDANIELAEEEDSFYVFGYLKKLRQSRKGLIENVDQYKFVYDTLEEYIVCGNSFFPVKDLSQKLKQKGIKDPATKLNEYQREYAQICKQTPRFSIGDCAGGHRADNREKNRDVLCVPPDNFRPYLTSFQGNAFTDYINAVFVDGYTKPREYIVTEWPLKSTCGEFWSLVYDHECSAVVVLCQPPHNSQTYPPFWPEGRHSKKYGPVFTIDHISHNHYSNIKTWIFRINKKVISLTELMAGVKAVPRTVQLFQLTCWPLSHKVPTSTNSLVELMNMVERWRQKAIGPVCVVSPDGRSRAGVYCAANACIEFIDFGRGKNIPLTPDTENLEQIKVKSNTGRIIIDKTITDFEFKSNILSSINEPPESSSRYVIDKDGKIIERKKKCRLYSLGGYEPRRQNLVRMKTVGTFDLCMEVTAAACGFSQSQRDAAAAVAAITERKNSEEQSVIQKDDNEYDSSSSSNINTKKKHNSHNNTDDNTSSNENSKNNSNNNNKNNNDDNSNFNSETVVVDVEPVHEEKNQSFLTASISPKRHISSSENSFTVDDTLISSNIKKKFRSLSSTNSYLANSRNSDEYRCKSAELLDSKASDAFVDEILTCAASACEFRNKSEEILFSSNNESREDVLSVEIDSKTSDDELSKFPSAMATMPLSYRRRTLKKSKKIVRTDSELFKDKKLLMELESSPARASSKVNSIEEQSGEIEDASSKNISTDTVFSEDMCDEDDDDDGEGAQIDLERLESEYKEHVRSSLQREYKSDGDSLDEIGKSKHRSEWKNQSIDFEFLEDDSAKYDLRLPRSAASAGGGKSSGIIYVRQKAESVECKPSSRKNSSKRTKSEGDKDTIYSADKNDSIETQSTTEDETNKTENEPSVSSGKEVKKLSLFERRFSKFCTMNKLLKVKRFSTSALYDNSKRKSDQNAKGGGKSNSTDQQQQQQQQQQNQQATPLSLYSQVGDFTSSKVSLASPKSLKGKKFMMKKRKFSFFGKSQSNNDINLNLKSIASKLSLLSKSNFDLSARNSSNPRLNAMGIYNKYGTSNEYRSDILTAKQHGCTSPLSEAFYNATGSYQLTAMELFEKFCSQDFTGLYHAEPLNESDEGEGKMSDAANHGAYKGAIKKSSSLRKATLLKQNSEPKFNIKSYSSSEYQSFYPNHPEAFEEEENDEDEEEEEEEEEEEGEEMGEECDDDYDYAAIRAAARRRSSYTRQHQVEFDQNDQYFEDGAGNFYLHEGSELYRGDEGDIDEIYFVPEKERYELRNSEEILAIDEMDEDILEEAEIEHNISVDVEIERADDGDGAGREGEKSQLLSLYEICPKERICEEEGEEGEGSDVETINADANLKNIITEYVKNTCGAAALPSTTTAVASESFLRSQSMDLLSNSSDTLKTNSNSEYAFDTVKQINLDSCSTSKLSLSLNSDIFDDITLAAIPDTAIKTLKISEIDDFTITPDGSITEGNEHAKFVAAVAEMSEQERVKNELQSQYTIIDCDELEHDDDDGCGGGGGGQREGDEMRRFNDEKSSFAEALNKEFDKLFSRVKTDSDTDLTTTPSVNTVLTAIKLPSRCSMEKLEPFEIDSDNIIGSISEEREQTALKAMSQSMTSTTLHQSVSTKKDADALDKNKSKRSHSLGAINKKKSNKCTPL